MQGIEYFPLLSLCVEPSKKSPRKNIKNRIIHVIGFLACVIIAASALELYGVSERALCACYNGETFSSAEVQPSCTVQGETLWSLPFDPTLDMETGGLRSDWSEIVPSLTCVPENNCHPTIVCCNAYVSGYLGNDISIDVPLSSQTFDIQVDIPVAPQTVDMANTALCNRHWWLNPLVGSIVAALVQVLFAVNMFDEEDEDDKLPCCCACLEHCAKCTNMLTGFFFLGIKIVVAFVVPYLYFSRMSSLGEPLGFTDWYMDAGIQLALVFFVFGPLFDFIWECTRPARECIEDCSDCL